MLHNFYCKSTLNKYGLSTTRRVEMILTQWIKMKYLLKQSRVCFEQIRSLSNGVMSRNMDDSEVIRTRHCTTVMEKPNGPLNCKKITSIQPVRWKKWVNPYPDLIEVSPDTCTHTNTHAQILKLHKLDVFIFPHRTNWRNNLYLVVDQVDKASTKRPTV